MKYEKIFIPLFLFLFFGIGFAEQVQFGNKIITLPEGFIQDPEDKFSYFNENTNEVLFLHLDKTNNSNNSVDIQNDKSIELLKQYWVSRNSTVINSEKLTINGKKILILPKRTVMSLNLFMGSMSKVKDSQFGDRVVLYYSEPNFVYNINYMQINVKAKKSLIPNYVKSRNLLISIINSFR